MITFVLDAIHTTLFFPVAASYRVPGGGGVSLGCL